MYICYHQALNKNFMLKLNSFKIFLIAIILIYAKTAKTQGWSQVDVGVSNKIYSVDYVNSSTVYMGGFDSITKTTDNGLTWQSMPYMDTLGNIIGQTWFKDMHFFNANEGLATGMCYGGNSEVVLRTDNGGLSWYVVSVNNNGIWPRMLNDFEFTSISTGFVVGTNGRLLRTLNGGDNWNPVTSNTNKELTGISFGSSLTGIIVGEQVILRTVNGGVSWSATNYSNYYLESVHFVNSSTAYAIGNVTLKTTDAGLTWTQISSTSGTDIYAINNDTAFLCNTGLFKTENQGQFWGSQSSVSVGNYYDIDFLNPGNGYVVGNNGMVFHTSSGGDPLAQHDAGIHSIQQYSQNTCPTSFDVKVKLKNYGTLPLNAASINWSVNGVIQNTYPWLGNVPTDSISPYILIGSIAYSGIPLNIEVWTSQPNGVTDQFLGNDSSNTVFSTQLLNGTYTIGGTNPDYPTFAAAVSQLNTLGICGNVVFNVRNGTYLETIIINNVNSLNNNGNVIFQSESGDSTAVTLVWNLANTLVINASKNITLKKMTIFSSNNSAIVLSGGANNIAIRNCIIKGVPISFSNNIPSVTLSTGGANNIIFENNSFVDGAVGINFVMSGLQNIVIKNNSFTGQKSEAIYLNSLVSPIISGNKIYSNANYNFNGIRLVSCTGVYEVSANQIYIDENSSNGAVYNGINIGNTSQDTISFGKIFNNYVGIKSLNINSKVSCFYLSDVYKLDIYNNTFYNSSNHIDAYSMDIFYNNGDATPPNLKFVNNIINASYSPAIRIRITNYSNLSGFCNNLFSVVGHNAYYAPSNNFFNIPSQYLGSNLTDWNNLFYKDSTSFIANPQFTSIYNFHIQPLTQNFALSNTGIPWNGLATDIDGNLRSSTPDIGADEFDIFTHDLEVINTTDTTTICAGNNPIQIEIVNHGSATINSFTTNWMINGVLQTPFIWNGNLLPGDTSAIITIGNYNFNAGYYNLKVWNTLSIGSFDYNFLNDTLNQVLLAGGLNGTYVIGTAPSDYLNISSAVTDLIQLGVCGPVTFDLKPGNYNQQITIPFILGSSATNKITLRAQNGDSTSVFWQYTATATNNYVLKLNAVKHFSLEKITIRSTSNSYSTAILMQDSCDEISIKSCRIIGAPYSSGKLVNCIGDAKSNINFLNNYFRYGETALYIEGSTAQFCDKININNNFFYNTYLYSIDILYTKTLKINNNIFSSDTSIDSYSSAINLFNTTFSVEINANHIKGQYKNALQWYSHYFGTFSKALITNNFIHASGTASISCLDLNSINNLYVINNTAFLQSNNNALYQTSNTIYGNNVNVLNNIFYSTTPTGNLMSYNLNMHICDHNIYYKPNGGRLFNAIHETLFSRKIFTPYDQNSYETNPMFVSNNDLHLLNSYYAEGNGNNAFLNTVGIDIDGDLRNNNPDIGADEFTLQLTNNDAGVTQILNTDINCAGNSPIKVLIRNYANNVLNNAKINWSVNGALQPIFNWAGTLPSLAVSDTVIIGNFNFTASDTFLIKAWTTLPNGITDNIAINDSATLGNIKTILSGVYTVGGANPDYTTLDAVKYDLDNYGICGPTTFMLRNGIYDYELLLDSIDGSSAINTITFRSESGNPNDVTIDGATAVKLRGTDYITFRDITLDGTYSPLIFEYGTSHINFINMKFLTGNVASSEGDNNNYTKFDSCYFWKGIGVGTNNSTAHRKGFIFKNNTLGGMNIWYMDSIEVSNNILTGGVYPNATKMSINYCENIIRICNNKLTGTANGIFISICTFDTTGGIFNNELAVTTTTPINVNVGGTVKIYNNSINSIGQFTNITGIYLDNGIFKVYNNSIKIAGGSFYSCPSVWSLPYLYANNNSFYATNQYNFTFGSTSYQSLIDFQTATGNDLNSLFIDPQYTTDTYLFPQEQQLFNAGQNVGLNYDINNSPRNPVSPTIGAYEMYTMPNVTLGADTIFCGSKLLNAQNPGSTYLWNTGATTQSILVSNSGAYWVTVTNGLGVDTDTINITVKPKPDVQLVANVDSVCIGACVAFNATVSNGTPNYSYNWSPSNLLSNPTIANPNSCIQNQLFTLVVSDNNSCKDTATYYFEAPQIPAITIDTVSAICMGETVLLNGNSSCLNCTFNWSPSNNLTTPNDISTIASPNANTTYTLTVTSNVGCQNTATASVFVNALPSTPVITQNINGLDCNSNATSYQWYLNGSPIFGATNNHLDFPSPGSYSVVVSNNFGCFDTSAAFVVYLTVSDIEVNESTFLIFPNPAKNEVYCNIELLNEAKGIVDLYDIIGNKIESKSISSGENKIVFDIQQLADGLYFFKIIIEDNLYTTKKLVVLKN